MLFILSTSFFTFYFGESLGRKQAKWAKKKPQVRGPPLDIVGTWAPTT